MPLHADREGQGRDACDPTLHGGTDGSTREKEAETAVEPDVHARDDQIGPALEERIYTQIRAVGGIAADGNHGDPLSLQVLDANLVPARDGLADPAALGIGDGHTHGPELAQSPDQRYESRRVHAIVIGDQDVPHPAEHNRTGAGPASSPRGVVKSR